jgi:hypothetical protein
LSSKLTTGLIGGLCLMMLFITPVQATQYDPPWAHNYDFNYDFLGKDTRPCASNAANIQDIVGYDAYASTNSGAATAYNQLKDDAVFSFVGHGNYGGGGMWFYDGSDMSLISALYHEVPEEQYSLSAMTTELKDVKIAVYVGCKTGATHQDFGNLVDLSYTKGVDNVIGFADDINCTAGKYWSDRFWQRCRTGWYGYPQKFQDAAIGAKTDVYVRWGDYGGIDSLYGKFFNIGGIPLDYLQPAEYGRIG